MKPPKHFRKRVWERIGSNEDPALLARELREAIQTAPNDYVEYLGRVDGRGDRRVFRFSTAGRIFAVIWSEKTQTPLTVLTEDMHVQRQGRAPVAVAAPS